MAVRDSGAVLASGKSGMRGVVSVSIREIDVDVNVKDDKAF
jgi:hypothetical protein